MISSPLRYPGGKAKLYPFFAELIKDNGLIGSDYCEPYAGGAGLAIKLLTTGFVKTISINDIDPSIYAFWSAALHTTDKFCALINRTPVNIDQWHRQQEIWEDGDVENTLALGFATYFLNRTNRSGIIEGAGPIGGYEQKGNWKLGVRLNKNVQIENLKALAQYKRQIKITNFDALKFFERSISKESSFVYLDPPYYIKGRKLYKNFYNPEDHVEIARALKKRRKAHWVVSYDDVPQIRKLYSPFCRIRYFLNYSAGEKSVGSEVIFVSDSLTPPSVSGFRVAA